MLWTRWLARLEEVRLSAEQLGHLPSKTTGLSDDSCTWMALQRRDDALGRVSDIKVAALDSRLGKYGDWRFADARPMASASTGEENVGGTLNTDVHWARCHGACTGHRVMAHRCPEVDEL
jgi:hypothetical protein